VRNVKDTGACDYVFTGNRSLMNTEKFSDFIVMFRLSQLFSED